MADRKVLIVGDSRAKHLSGFLDREYIHLDYALIWQSGLTLSNTYNFAKSTILEIKPKLIHILTGVCDVTEIRSHSPRLVLLRNPTVNATVYSYITRADLLHSMIFSLRTVLGWDPMIIFPTQVGIDLARYNHFPHDLIHPHQVVLNNAMMDINRYMIAQNNRMHITTPFLAGPIHTRCRGKPRHMYGKLQDGCHLSPQISWIWAEQLYENSLINANKYDSYYLANLVSNN